MIHSPGPNVETVMKNAQRAISRWQLFGRLAGTGLLLSTGAIHLDLYVTGYRSIPTIGWLFLLQVIAAFGLAALIAATSSRLASAAGAGFALSTLGGYLLSIWVGLFAFKEVRTTAGVVAGVIEVAAFTVLALVVVGPRARLGASSTLPTRPQVDRLHTGARRAEAAVVGASLVAVALLGTAVATARGPGSAATGGWAERRQGK